MSYLSLLYILYIWVLAPKRLVSTKKSCILERQLEKQL